jgi:hypothetical protein
MLTVQDHVIAPKLAKPTLTSCFLLKYDFKPFLSANLRLGNPAEQEAALCQNGSSRNTNYLIISNDCFSPPISSSRSIFLSIDGLIVTQIEPDLCHV